MYCIVCTVLNLISAKTTVIQHNILIIYPQYMCKLSVLCIYFLKIIDLMREVGLYWTYVALGQCVCVAQSRDSIGTLTVCLWRVLSDTCVCPDLAGS